MSGHHIHQVFTRSAAQPSHRFILACLAYAADFDGVASLSQRRIAEMVGLSKTAVSEGLTSLQKSGELVLWAEGDGRRATAYRINLEKVVEKKAEPVTPTIMPDHDAASAPEPVGFQPLFAPNLPAKPKSTNSQGDLRALMDAMASEASEPEPPKTFTGIPPHLPQDEVGLIMQAAGIEPDPMTPFYWHGAAHKADAKKIIAAAGSPEDAVSRIKRARVEVGGIRRLSALLQYVQKGGRG